MSNIVESDAQSPQYYRIQNVITGRFLKVDGSNNDRPYCSANTQTDTSGLEWFFSGVPNSDDYIFRPRDFASKALSHEDSSQDGFKPKVDSFTTASDRRFRLSQNLFGPTLQNTQGDDAFTILTDTGMFLVDDGDDLGDSSAKPEPQLRTQRQDKAVWRFVRA